MTPQELVTLKVDGREWGGWEEAKLDNFFGKSLCSRMDVTLPDKWRQDFKARPIRTGMKYELWLGSELRQTGYISKVNPGYGPKRHGITVSGRDFTAELVDCSSTVPTGSFTYQKIEAIAATLCKEFGVPVVAGDDTGAPIPQVQMQVGETPFQILEKLCRKRNVWLASTIQGALTFQKASTIKLPGVLVRGRDIEEADADYSDEGRFSAYIGMGQQRGSDQIGPEAAALVTGQVTDSSITRHRPLIVQAEDQQDGETIVDRLKNEMNKRIGDSRSVKIRVAGWRLKDGTVWPVNRRVAIDDDWLGLNDEYLIEQASFEIGKNSNATTLTLVPPQKYDISYTGTPLQPAITNDDSRPWDRTIGPI